MRWVAAEVEASEASSHTLSKERTISRELGDALRADELSAAVEARTHHILKRKASLPPSLTTSLAATSACMRFHSTLPARHHSQSSQPHFGSVQRGEEAVGKWARWG